MLQRIPVDGCIFEGITEDKDTGLLITQSVTLFLLRDGTYILECVTNGKTTETAFQSEAGGIHAYNEAVKNFWRRAD